MAMEHQGSPVFDSFLESIAAGVLNDRNDEDKTPSPIMDMDLMWQGGGGPARDLERESRSASDGGQATSEAISEDDRSPCTEEVPVVPEPRAVPSPPRKASPPVAVARIPKPAAAAALVPVRAPRAPHVHMASLAPEPPVVARRAIPVATPVAQPMQERTAVPVTIRATAVPAQANVVCCLPAAQVPQVAYQQPQVMLRPVIMQAPAPTPVIATAPQWGMFAQR
eukprot:Hpha_TRINITY_DN16354_c5_g3::TRINITY_DN16354_c5_g3_i1::g.60380::m.60380